jgi:hypothetical protein
MKPTKLIFLFAAVCLFFFKTSAQSSYLYIQGDKEKPFYVKVNGVMSNRYGKNYCIFPQLKEGTWKVEILYEQNTVPSQENSIIIPNNSFRAFLLAKKDGNYALYDIHQQFYLKPGDADHYFANQTMTEAPIAVEEKKPEEPKKEIEKPKKVFKAEEPKKEEKKKIEEPQFVNNVVINEADETPANNTIKTNKEEPKPTTTNPTKTEQTKEVKLESNATPIYNNNCPTAMRDKDYDDLLKNAKAIGKGDKLVKFLLGKIPSNCYTTKQVYQLADLLDEEAIIYLYLKRVYPQVSDQQNFHLLETYLFETEEWIKAFRLIH